MDFLAELRHRGLLHDVTPGLDEHLAAGEPVTAYIGFDPTAPSLTIGNYVPIMLLKLFQLGGHQPIMLFGGATGRIGDPSGGDAERDLKTAEELGANLAAQRAQARRLLARPAGRSDLREVIFVDNHDFYRGVPVLDFLRDVGKTLTVNYMLSKDSVRSRLETGISFTEFSYQLLQGYDFQRLYADHACTLQMGGSDQWGNITAGTEFVRRNLGGKAYGLTAPLLTKADGSKFGKSEGGNVWLDPARTSPYQFYQFWLNADDRDLPRYLRTFSLRDRASLDEAVARSAEGAAAREVKRELAEELTARIHGAEALASAAAVSKLLFDRRADAAFIAGLSAADFGEIAREIPSRAIPRETLGGEGLGLAELLSDRAAVVASRSEARRAVQGNAVSLNKAKATDPEAAVTTADLLHGRYLLIENGKKNKVLVEAI